MVYCNHSSIHCTNWLAVRQNSQFYFHTVDKIVEVYTRHLKNSWYRIWQIQHGTADGRHSPEIFNEITDGHYTTATQAKNIIHNFESYTWGEDNCWMIRTLQKMALLPVTSQLSLRMLHTNHLPDKCPVHGLIRSSKVDSLMLVSVFILP